MLRTRPDATFEFRALEAVIRAAAPPSLAPERREALRLRIFAQLGVQAAPARGLRPALNQRWIAIPVGVGVAAAVVAASRPLLETMNPPGGDGARVLAYGSFSAGGREVAIVAVGQQLTAETDSDVVVPDARISLESGTVFTLEGAGAGSSPIVVQFVSGEGIIASDGKAVEIGGPGWRATIQEGGVVRVSALADGTWILDAIEGDAVVTAGGTTCAAPAGTRVLITGSGSCIAVPGAAAGSLPLAPVQPGDGHSPAPEAQVVLDPPGAGGAGGIGAGDQPPGSQGNGAGNGNEPPGGQGAGGNEPPGGDSGNGNGNQAPGGPSNNGGGNEDGDQPPGDQSNSAGGNGNGSGDAPPAGGGQGAGGQSNNGGGNGNGGESPGGGSGNGPGGQGAGAQSNNGGGNGNGGESPGGGSGNVPGGQGSGGQPNNGGGNGNGGESPGGGSGNVPGGQGSGAQSNNGGGNASGGESPGGGSGSGGQGSGGQPNNGGGNGNGGESPGGGSGSGGQGSGGQPNNGGGNGNGGGTGGNGGGGSPAGGAQGKGGGGKPGGK